MSTDEDTKALEEVMQLHSRLSRQLELLQAQLGLAQAKLCDLAEQTRGVKPAGADAVDDFIADCCAENCPENDGDGTKALHATYLRYCRANAVPSSYWVGERDFRECLIGLGFEQAKSNGRRFWRGLQLLSGEPIPIVTATTTHENEEQ